MSKEQFLQDQEEEHQELINQGICRDAAIMVVDWGHDRHSAIMQATEISENQQEISSDITGTLETLEESQSPDMPKEKSKQVHKVAAELYNQFYG